MTLSLIITHYRTPEMLKLALGYFEKALESFGEESEIIVSDSGTLNDTRDLMAAFPRHAYLPETKNVGYAKTVNRGLARAQGEFVCIANADIVASDANVFRLLIDYMRSRPQVGILGPRLMNFNGTVQQSAFRFYTPLTLLARRTFFRETPAGKRLLARFYMDDVPQKQTGPTPVDWLMGSMLLARKSAITQVGPLDERFFMYMEDVDWCRRFWEKKWQVIYYPAATMHHYHFQASKKKGGGIIDLLTNPYTRTHLKSAVIFFRKYGLRVPRYGM